MPAFTRSFRHEEFLSCFPRNGSSVLHGEIVPLYALRNLRVMFSGTFQFLDLQDELFRNAVYSNVRYYEYAILIANCDLLPARA